MACFKCIETGQCVIKDAVNEFRRKAYEADGFVVGSPTHYAGMSGNLVGFMDRLFFSEFQGNGNKAFCLKPAAAVVSARRAGTTSVFEQLVKYFTVQEMPVVSTRYWNMVHGMTAEEVEQDGEGLYNMRVLARNMAYIVTQGGILMNLTRRKFLKLIGFTLINTGLFGMETGCGFSPKTSDSNFVKDWATLQTDNVPIEYNGKKYSRVLAIGDIHGQYTRFMSMYQKLDVTDNDLVIFLGDYVQGDKTGEDLKTLQGLIQNSGKPNFIMLSGNMEREALKDCFTEDGNLKENLGKKWAFADDLKVHNLPQFNKKVFGFMSSLKFYFPLTIDGKDFVFCHAGIKDGVSLEKQDEFSLMFNKEFYQEYNGDKIVVIGHRPVQTVYGERCTVPVKVPDRNILMVDTRCKREKGYSSCVNILTGEFWQSDKDW